MRLALSVLTTAVALSCLVLAAAAEFIGPH
jgi:hypothetical protein